MEQEKEVQSSYHLTEVNPPETGQGPVDYVNIIQEGFLLPHFSLSDSSGNKFVLKDLIGTKNIILVFLHRSDCFCTAFFLEELQANLAEMKSYNAVAAAVSVEHPKLISKFASRLKLEFPVLCDRDQTAVRLYAVFDRDPVRGEAHPAIYLADLQGVIKQKQVSLQHADKLSLPALLERLKEI